MAFHPISQNLPVFGCRDPRANAQAADDAEPRRWMGSRPYNDAMSNPSPSAARVEVDSIESIVAVLAESERVVPVGNVSKPGLAPCESPNAAATTEQGNATRILMPAYRGMLDYEPSEYMFTAKAGTTLAEIIDVLAQRDQYLPFDPMLVRGEATLGGTIATGLSGPGRFRFGGLRDFLMGAKLVLSNGDVVNTGGKVVKNAAGFDIPKLIIGSLGSLGVIAEVSMKVFPKPIEMQSVAIQVDRHEDAVGVMADLARTAFELDAVDYDADGGRVWLRLAGPPSANRAIANRLLETYSNAVNVESDLGREFWNATTELTWMNEQLDGHERVAVAKVPMSLSGLVEFLTRLPTATSTRVSAAGQTAWVAVHDVSALDSLRTTLDSLGLPGLLVQQGKPHGNPLLGPWPKSDVAQAIKRAMDPLMKFPSIL